MRDSETNSSQKRPRATRRTTLAVLGGFSLLVYAVLLLPIRRSPLISLELLAYDWGLSSLPQRKPDSRIVIVGMDEATPAKLPDFARPQYPLPRSYHARVLDNLRVAGARIVGWDVMFTTPQREDKEFVAAIRRHGRVLAAARPTATMTPDGEEMFRFDDGSPALRGALRLCSILIRPRLGRVRSLEPFPPDSETGRRYPHLSLSLAALADAPPIDFAASQPTIRDGVLRWDSRSADVPLTDNQEFLIRYIGPGGTFAYVPYHEVHSGVWRTTRGAGFFQNKIVIVGALLPLEDRHNTPLGAMAGVEILANSTQAFLIGDFVRALPLWTTFLIGAMLTVLLLVVLGRFGLVWMLGALPLLGMLWVFAAHALFVTMQVWADMVTPLIALILTAGVGAVYETQRTRRVFERFVPSWAARRALTGGAMERGGGVGAMVEREITAVFCDVRNYTSLTETLPPNELTALQQEYYEAAERLARQFGTEIDKYVGDGVMLTFWDTGRRGEEAHPLRAVRWSLAIQSWAHGMDTSGRAGDIGFRVGVGVATGVAREGFIGQARMQSTVIGDVVNTAARLQEATKELEKPILMTMTTFSHVARNVQAEPVGDVRVKGKREPIAAFCPIRLLDEPTPLEERELPR